MSKVDTASIDTGSCVLPAVLVNVMHDADPRGCGEAGTPKHPSDPARDRMDDRTTAYAAIRAVRHSAASDAESSRVPVPLRRPLMAPTDRPRRPRQRAHLQGCRTATLTRFPARGRRLPLVTGLAAIARLAPTRSPRALRACPPRVGQRGAGSRHPPAAWTGRLTPTADTCCVIRAVPPTPDSL